MNECVNECVIECVYKVFECMKYGPISHLFFIFFFILLRLNGFPKEFRVSLLAVNNTQANWKSWRLKKNFIKFLFKMECLELFMKIKCFFFGA